MDGNAISYSPRLTFSLNRLGENVHAFRAICERTLVSCRYESYFPIKVAPAHAIVECLGGLGFGLEVMSPRTVEVAQASPGSRLILSGPVKCNSLIAQGIRHNWWTFISCESMTDLARVNAVAARHETKIDVLLRLKATANRRLGMSLEDARRSLDHAGDLSSVRIAGLHLHSGSNITGREADLALERMHLAAKDLARHGLSDAILNFGGGFPCIGQNEAEIERRLAGIDSLAKRLRAEVIIEPGRALVGDAAELVTEVVDVRPHEHELTINSSAYVVHGPCNADKFIVHRRPGETWEHRYRVVKRKEANFRVGGIWPAEGDSLWLDVPTPEFAIGDEFVFPQAGAYTLGFLAELAFDDLIPHFAS